MNSDFVFARLVQRIDPSATLIRAWPLTGGVSACTHALEFESSGQCLKFVVRQHGKTDLDRNPGIASDEFRVLRALDAAGLAVPAPVHLDDTCDIFDSPVVVIQHIDGTSEIPQAFEDCVDQMAAQLAMLHGLSVSNLRLPDLPLIEEMFGALLGRESEENDLFDERRIRSVLNEFSEPPERQKSCLLHGDFWPGNILWKSGRLVALIDWEDAAIGSPLSDVANARLELLWSLGPGAMLDFTRRYLAITNISAGSLPWWDLFTALKVAGKFASWSLSPDTEVMMRVRHHFFVQQAIDQLTASQPG